MRECLEVSFDGCFLVGVGKCKKWFFSGFDCGEDGVEACFCFFVSSVL